jgi:hypothetical protein
MILLFCCIFDFHPLVLLSTCYVWCVNIFLWKLSLGVQQSKDFCPVVICGMFNLAKFCMEVNSSSYYCFL